MKQKRSTEGCWKLKSPETRQVQERLVSTLEHMRVPKWDKTRCPEELCPLLACRTRCKCSVETLHNELGFRFLLFNIFNYLFLSLHALLHLISHFLAHLSQRLKWAIVIAHRPSSVRPSVNFHIFDFFSRTAWWILMKLGRYEVLMVPYKCCCFSARSAQGRIQGGAKIGHGGPLL